MTIGQRIRYCRTLRGISQTQLALDSCVHPVSVRKYETDKMQPQPEQILRIAKALHVSYSALAGVDMAGIDGSRQTDTMSLLMILVNAGILKIDSPLLSNGETDIHNTTFSLQTCLTDVFNLRVKGADQKVELSDIELLPKCAIAAQSLTTWQKKKAAYQEAAKETGDNLSEEDQARLHTLKEDLEVYELQIQAEDYLTKIPPSITD
ncbi:MAG: helix-turn-helix transcriptional regulator [Clostridia bacterium]